MYETKTKNFFQKIPGFRVLCEYFGVKAFGDILILWDAL